MPKQVPIDIRLTEHLGELAQISLSTEQQTQLRRKLQQLVDAFSTLDEADLPPPDHHRSGQKAAVPAITPEQLRDDIPTPPLRPSEVLANAPQTAADCFVVTRVVEP